MPDFSMKRMLSALALIASLGSLGTFAAHASTPLRGFMFGIPNSTMSKADWAAFYDAAGQLLDQMPSTVGQSKEWTGPSGASGTVTIEKIYEDHDMPCRHLHAQFNRKNNARTLNYGLAVCRDAQGTWRLGS